MSGTSNGSGVTTLNGDSPILCSSISSWNMAATSCIVMSPAYTCCRRQHEQEQTDNTKKGNRKHTVLMSVFLDAMTCSTRLPSLDSATRFWSDVVVARSSTTLRIEVKIHFALTAVLAGIEFTRALKAAISRVDMRGRIVE